MANNLQSRVLRNNNQRIRSLEDQFYNGGASLKDIVRATLLNAQMIDSIRSQNLYENAMILSRTTDPQTQTEYEMIYLDPQSSLSYYDEGGSTGLNGTLKINRFSTATELNGNFFVITNDGRILIYSEKEKIAAVFDVDKLNDFISLRNDAGTETIRVNRETGTIQSPIGDFTLLTADTMVIDNGTFTLLTADTMNATTVHVEDTIEFPNGFSITPLGDDLLIRNENVTHTRDIVLLKPDAATDEYQPAIHRVELENSNLIFRNLNAYRENPKVYAQWSDGLNDKSIGFEFDYYTGTNVDTKTFARMNVLGNGYKNETSLQPGNSTVRTGNTTQVATFESDGRIRFGQIESDTTTGVFFRTEDEGKTGYMRIRSEQDENVSVVLDGSNVMEPWQFNGTVRCDGSLYVSDQILLDNDVIHVRPLEVTGNATNLAKFESIRDSSYIEINNKEGTRALFGCDGYGFGGGDNTSVLLANWTEGDLAFATNAKTRMTIDKDGQVGIGTNTPSELLDVRGNVSIGDTLVFQKDTTFDGSITADLATYQIYDGQIRTSSIFQTETTMVNSSAHLQPVRMADFSEETGLSRTWNIGKESARRVFNFTGPIITRDFTLHLQRPYNEQTGLYIPLEHDILLCSLGSPRDFQIDLIMTMDDGSTYGLIWGFVTKKEYSGTPLTLTSVETSFANGAQLVTISGVQGEIRFKIKSCGDGIAGDGAYLIDIEVYKL